MREYVQVQVYGKIKVKVNKAESSRRRQSPKTGHATLLPLFAVPLCCSGVDRSNGTTTVLLGTYLETHHSRHREARQHIYSSLGLRERPRCRYRFGARQQHE